MEERLIVLFSVTCFFFLALSSCVQIDHLYFDRYHFSESAWWLQHMQ